MSARVWLAILAAAAGGAARGQDPVVYDNSSTPPTDVLLAGGAAVVGTNTITNMLADDIALAAAGPFRITQIGFVVGNTNAATTAFRPVVRFYDNDGGGGRPGTLIGSYTFAAVALPGAPAGSAAVAQVTRDISATPLVTPDNSFWAGLAFDNANGTLGTTAGQLDGLAHVTFDAPTVGSSTSAVFYSSEPGDFSTSFPPGDVLDFGDLLVLNLGWSFRGVPVPEPAGAVAAAGGLLGLWRLRRAARR